MNARCPSSPPVNHPSLQRYYQHHAPIYDATRWTFLFGRSRLLAMLEQGPPPARVLEVGCGTGGNLVHLARRFPNACFTGVDLSQAMLARARRRTQKGAAEFRWLQASYDHPLHSAAPFDLVLCSYSLSLMNPGWEAALAAAATDLAPHGRIAVVDFDQTPLSCVRRWLNWHQVRVDGHLLPSLGQRFHPQLATRRSAYGGAWQYFLFLGRNETSARNS